MTDASLKAPSSDLRSLTAARVSLQMTGHTLATSEILAFQLAHAKARDAVHATFNVEHFAQRVREELPILSAHGIEVLIVRSGAADRADYLRHPDKGRTLQSESAALLKLTSCDVAITIADGLSALAVERNAIPLLTLLLPPLTAAGSSLGPITVVQQGRVGISDPIGEGLGARLSLMLIGERPGLSADDSMGAYLTWDPRIGRTDAERNCLSNIRTGGLSVADAAERLMALMTEARARRLTGISLKEGTASLLRA